MRKVTIIGAGPGNPDLLSRAALDAIDIADVVIGAHRALAGIDVPPDVVRCELVKTADIVAACAACGLFVRIPRCDTETEAAVEAVAQ